MSVSGIVWNLEDIQRVHTLDTVYEKLHKCPTDAKNEDGNNYFKYFLHGRPATCLRPIILHLQHVKWLSALSNLLFYEIVLFCKPIIAYNIL